MERRKFIKLSSVASAGLFTAGCMGNDEPQGADATKTTKTTETTATETGTETENTTETSTATVASLDIYGENNESIEGLKITNRELYRTNGEVGLRGTVENVGNKPFESVEVEVVLQDDQGEVLDEVIDETEEDEIDRLTPGNTWEFEVIFEEAQMAEVTSYTINLNGEVADSTQPAIEGQISTDSDPRFVVVSHNFSRSGESGRVTGKIQNIANETANTVEVSATLYDEEDNQIDLFTNSLEEDENTDQIGPDETWNFDVQFTDIDMQNVEYYAISVESHFV